MPGKPNDFLCFCYKLINIKRLIKDCFNPFLRNRCYGTDPATVANQSAQHNWIAAHRGEVELLPSAEIGLNTMLISEGIYLSQKLGREVTAAEVLEKSVSTALDV